MALKGNEQVTSNHEMNGGVSLVVDVQASITLDASSHTNGQAMHSGMITVSGALRNVGNTAWLRHICVKWYNTSAPVPKSTKLLIFNKTAIPATLPVASADLTLADGDANYLIGSVNIPSSGFETTSLFSVCNLTVNIPIWNDDANGGTSIYCVLVHDDSTSSYTATEKIYLNFAIEQN